jgi:hypothetical protein
MFYRDDRIALLAAALMLLVIWLMLLRSSDPAFAATSATWPSGFTREDVALVDDDAATSMFLR